ncbi:hypothetical protein LXL04_023997 [Taraxacum kok-saghyz]
MKTTLEDESDEDQDTEKEGDECADLEEDDLVDEENNVPEVEVDMADFTLNLDGDESEIHIDEGAADEEVDGVDVLDNERWDSLDEGSDDDMRRRNYLKNLGKEKRCNLGNVHKASFYVGQKFKLRAKYRGVVVGSLSSGLVATTKSKDKCVNSKKEGCKWALHASRSNEESDWFVKTLKDNHSCLRSRKLRACTATFISKEILSQIETDPRVPLRALVEQIESKYEVGVSMDKIFRAKAAATKIVVGPLKKGFKACGRDILGFDGAFMKGPFPGQVLTAVGLDSNNGIYPVAYAIVESENMASWKWFLDCLGDDLDLGINSNFTFITDRQKGLIPAICSRFPHSEHRFCLRHIYQNMKKVWKPIVYKDYLWKCATATTIPEFEHFMSEFSFYDKAASEWLKKIPPRQWARSHFTGREITDILLNNLCEVFNSKLIDGRDKPIIGCLEYIRQYLMKRICNVMKVMDKATGPLTPTTTSILEANCQTLNLIIWLTLMQSADLFSACSASEDQASERQSVEASTGIQQINLLRDLSIC